ncbi:THUMP-like domain-containing protein [Flavobacterium litorale]|uniref:Class I SAM-dependent methyltransferase n=1 Tax=Flavobacterium litorale TaxID=2856519 RepID=A0ABX8V572_9FLAO|nr:class I SAM-dependent methyltransferase [Flavobacterium litorale]QYJ67637.1 class I SAM-dependent methyltransferase [Flavobacterium litorale]
MNPDLLAPEIQQYIIEHTGEPIQQLALKKNPFTTVAWREIVSQIASRQKAKDKLPTWYNTNGIIYPEKISVEQTSSEIAAQYKAELISGESLIDLTGGFGIDDYYFAKRIKKVTHCEMNTALSAIVAHNFKVLPVTNIKCIAGDSTATLKDLGQQHDWIYVDPSRRSDSKGKVFLLEDCLPNVPQLLNFYFEYTNKIMIKTAPLLDISAGLSELSAVKAIHIVAIHNEVKELLWILEKGFKGTTTINAVAITKEETKTFKTTINNNAVATYALPKHYLYEPNSAVMKSGAFTAVSAQFGIDKLHQHSQLYTSDKLVAFAGRRFIIQNTIPYQKAAMKEYVWGKKMNVTVRNFPLTVTDIKKKWKIKDGGTVYAFFTTNMQNDKIVLLCAKI